MTIVCATRFSEESAQAAAVAAELARRHKETLWLVHGVPARTGKGPHDAIAESAVAALKGDAVLLARGGDHVKTALLTGRLEEEVARFCVENAARLLVVGDTSHTQTFFSGGPLDRLAYGIEAPVLVMRDARPFTHSANGGGPLKVMLALDRTSSSAVARDWISRLSEYGPIELVASHIFWPREEYDRLGQTPPLPEEGHRALTAQIQAEMEAALVGLPESVTTRRVHIEMGKGRTADQLVSLAGEEQVDLLVMGSHRRRALGKLWSVSHACLKQAPMSVACVPAMTAVPHVSVYAPWTRLVAATDFTESGNHALAYALSMMRDGGTLHLVHVTPEPVSEAIAKSLALKLTDALPQLGAARMVKVETHVLQGGRPGQEISGLADALRADVVCIGSRGKTQDKKAPVGPVVEDVVKHCQRPVFIARPSDL